tara:strand:- start:1950 stop:2570 length:621 start_codon:yes stop_codon:yes gene_type:complete
MSGFLDQMVESFTLPEIDFTLHDVMPEEVYAKDRERFHTTKDVSCTSDEALRQALKITNPRYFNHGHANQKRLDRQKLNVPLLENFLVKHIGGKSIGDWVMSGAFAWEKGEFMGWHTNYTSPGIRCYFAYSFEDNSNIFRYRNPYTEEVIDSYDKKGWNLRLFYVNEENPFWHAIVINSKRISLGFNNLNPSPKLIEKTISCYQSQ